MATPAATAAPRPAPISAGVGTTLFTCIHVVLIQARERGNDGRRPPVLQLEYDVPEDRDGDGAPSPVVRGQRRAEPRKNEERARLAQDDETLRPIPLHGDVAGRGSRRCGRRRRDRRDGRDRRRRGGHYHWCAAERRCRRGRDVGHGGLGLSLGLHCVNQRRELETRSTVRETERLRVVCGFARRGGRQRSDGGFDGRDETEDGRDVGDDFGDGERHDSTPSFGGQRSLDRRPLFVYLCLMCVDRGNGRIDGRLVLHDECLDGRHDGGGGLQGRQRGTERCHGGGRGGYSRGGRHGLYPAFSEVVSVFKALSWSGIAALARCHKSSAAFASTMSLSVLL